MIVPSSCKKTHWSSTWLSLKIIGEENVDSGSMNKASVLGEFQVYDKDRKWLRFGKKVTKFSNCNKDLKKSQTSVMRSSADKSGSQKCRSTRLVRLISILRNQNLTILIRTSRKKFISSNKNYSTTKNDGFVSSFICLRKRSANICWNTNVLEMKSSPSTVALIAPKHSQY